MTLWFRARNSRTPWNAATPTGDWLDRDICHPKTGGATPFWQLRFHTPALDESPPAREHKGALRTGANCAVSRMGCNSLCSTKTCRSGAVAGRYHTHIVKPGEVETCHDQVGYWLWEPATGNLIQTLAIPRGQIVMAFGRAMRDATSFELVATRGATNNGICSNPFLEYAFQTVEYRINVTINPDGTWSYDEDTTLIVHGQSEPFHHTDRSVLTKVGAPTPNPLAQR